MNELPVPRVERREWSGPTSRFTDHTYTTAHWVVVTKDGPMLNAAGRIKKFRKPQTAQLARAVIAQQEAIAARIEAERALLARLRGEA